MRTNSTRSPRLTSRTWVHSQNSLSGRFSKVGELCNSKLHDWEIYLYNLLSPKFLHCKFWYFVLGLKVGMGVADNNVQNNIFQNYSYILIQMYLQSDIIDLWCPKFVGSLNHFIWIIDSMMKRWIVLWKQIPCQVKYFIWIFSKCSIFVSCEI